MPTFEELVAVAYRSERVAGRRLARQNGVPEASALRQLLEEIAGEQSLHQFVASRAAARASAADAVAARKHQKLALLAQKKVSLLPDPSAWAAWFDGATRPNPGQMGIGGLLKGPAGQRIEISKAVGQGDSSEAEYLALIAVLEAAVTIRPDRLLVYGDSQVVINDVNGLCAITVPRVQEHAQKAAYLLSQLDSVTLAWLPRARNAEADTLSQRALDRIGIA